MIRIAQRTNDNLVIVSDFLGTEWFQHTYDFRAEIATLAARDGTVFCVEWVRNGDSFIGVFDAENTYKRMRLCGGLSGRDVITPFMVDDVLHASFVYANGVKQIGTYTNTWYSSVDDNYVGPNHPLVLHNGIYYPSYYDSAPNGSNIGRIRVKQSDPHIFENHVCVAINPWTVYTYSLGDDKVYVRDVRMDDIMTVNMPKHQLTAEHLTLSCNILPTGDIASMHNYWADTGRDAHVRIVDMRSPGFMYDLPAPAVPGDPAMLRGYAEFTTV